MDLYQPVTDEVLGGLFARVFRFLQTFVLDYHLWADDLGNAVLRMMLESVFYMRFLAEENDTNLFSAFQEYGIGQEKLYKMQLRKLLEEGKLKDAPELRSFIDSDSDEEVSDELVNVRLNMCSTISRRAPSSTATGRRSGDITLKRAGSHSTDCICNPTSDCLRLIQVC